MKKRGRVIGLMGKKLKIRLNPELIPDSACGSVAHMEGSGESGCAGCSGCSNSEAKALIIETLIPQGREFSIGEEIELEFSPLISSIFLLLGLGLPLCASLGLLMYLGGLPFPAAKPLAFFASLGLFSILVTAYILLNKKFPALQGIRIL